MAPDAPTHLGDALTTAFDFMIEEAGAELAEHEAECSAAATRLDNLIRLRAHMAPQQETPRG